MWRISDSGKVRSYDVGGGATGIASAHGSLWVSERDGSQIIKLGLDGSKTAYPLAPGVFPTDIVLGSDGALWFNELRGNAIGRLTKDGQLTEYPLPTPDAFLADLTAGPDGALVHGVQRQRDRPDHDRRRDHRIRAPGRREHAERHHRRRPTARCGSPSSTATRSAA